MTRNPKKNAPDATLLVREKPILSDALLSQNTNELAKLLDSPLGVLEFITGLVKEDRKSRLATIGGTLQALATGRTEEYLCSQIKRLRDAGKIPDEFDKHEEGMWSFVDIFKAVDGGEEPTKEKLDALIALFYGVVKMNATDIERTLNHRYLRIALSLKSSELQLLAVVHKQFVNNSLGVTSNAMKLQDWALKTAREYSTDYPLDLVLQDQKALMERGLLSAYRDATVTEERQEVLTLNARLTQLGIAFCQKLETCVRDSLSKATT
jgi:hypothetical protein